MELNPFCGEFTMSQPHDNTVFRFRADLERLWNSRYHERVISRSRETLRQAIKQALAIMKNRTHFAVHQRGSSYDLSAENLADTLVSKANTQYRNCFVEMSNHIFG